MIELLLGIVCGIALSLFFSFGPAFFQQLQTSIHYGFHKAYPFAFGVSVGDLIIVFLMLTVLKNVDMYELLHNVYVASIGGAVMCVMGIYTFRKHTVENPHSQEGPSRAGHLKFASQESAPRRRTIFLQGFAINFTNPIIWIYWVSVISLLSGELDIPTNHMYIFFVGVLGSTLGLDILKSKLASLLQRIITARVLNIFNKATGIIMFGFAGYLIVSMLVYQLNPKAMENEQQPSSTEMIRKLHVGLQHTESHHAADTLQIDSTTPLDSAIRQ